MDVSILKIHLLALGVSVPDRHIVCQPFFTIKVRKGRKTTFVKMSYIIALSYDTNETHMLYNWQT